ncbi:MAG: 4-amino-4-deoxy-L-arabinose transferase [Firmicutes bacterium HGW-Firmicutes-7]|nr:MAG: 4-amino-4-deoxy-L-arabinose transferase [Firmicutes bacterium HGW-Firmicutes-7]
MNNKSKSAFIIVLFLLLYFITSIFFLTSFPFVHSDEAWLSGLTRNMMDTHNIYCTEAFFDLYPRHPHSIKIIFHLIQMPFIYFLGYNIFTVRLISLIISLISLLIFYKVILNIQKNAIIAIMATILLSLNLQFIYASHFARQEIIILFFLMLGLYVYFSLPAPSFKSTLILGCIIGISIGIHPNSFLLALIFGFIYMYDWIIHEKSFKELSFLIIIVAGFAIVFIFLSLLGDPNFLTHYSQYGSTFGVDLPIGAKLFTLDDFYLKIFNSISATYYVPPMKHFWITFIILIPISIGVLISKRFANEKSRKTLKICIISLFAVQIGILLIGRYNSTSVLFFIPFFYIMLVNVISILFHNVKIQYVLYCTLIVLSFVISLTEIKPFLHYRYEDYLSEFSSVIPKDSKTLGNLNSDFYFDNSALLDYRNLAFIEVNDLSFQEYIDKNGIEYIVHYEELDYIHNNVNWLILYGEDHYYDQMTEFIQNECTLVHSFTDSMYGIRIPKYMMEYEWKISIYQVYE